MSSEVLCFKHKISLLFFDHAQLNSFPVYGSFW